MGISTSAKEFLYVLDESIAPVRRHLYKQWHDGVFKDLSRASQYGSQEFTPIQNPTDYKELKYYLTAATVYTPPDAGEPKPLSERVMYSKARIMEFVAASKATYFGLKRGEPLPDNCPQEKISGYVEQVFSLFRKFVPMGLQLQGDWEDSVAPLLFSEVIAQFSDNSEYLFLDGPSKPEDYILKAMTKSFFDNVPPDTHQKWLKVMGKYSPGEFGNWVNAITKLDDRANYSEIQGKFTTWSSNPNFKLTRS